MHGNYYLDMLKRLLHNNDMNRLPTKTRAAVISALVEGCSIRSTARLTGVSKPTVLRLLAEAGAVALKFQDQMFRDLNCRRLQVDEMWSFVYAKAKNVTPAIAAKVQSAGDAWLWVAIDADTKLVPCWAIGPRDASAAHEFMNDLAGRLTNRVQLTTDGLKAYLEAVDHAFGGFIDYSQLVKLYGSDPEGEKRYSPAKCIGCERKRIVGDPDPNHISTSYIERQNLTVRMTNRRFTRLTNAFSKKIENHIASIALGYFAYNFVRIHRTLRVTPAMAAGVTSRLWDVSDLVAMLEAEEASLYSAAA
jgi:IS1 family transposase